MNPALKLSLAAVALVGGTVLATAAALRPQDKPAGSQDKPAGGGMDDPAMMAKMMKLAAPGDAHKELMKRAGQWEEEYKMRTSPDGPWMEFKGTSESKPLLGGRFLMMTTKFSMMGMSMEGLQILGYDNMKQEYTSLWADSGSTWWSSSRGKKDANGNIEMKGTMVDVADERPFRMVIQPKGDDLIEIEFYYPTPPAGEGKMMTITSKRKK